MVFADRAPLLVPSEGAVIHEPPTLSGRIARAARNVLGYAGLTLGATVIGAGTAYVYGDNWLDMRASTDVGSSRPIELVDQEFGDEAGVSTLEFLTLSGAVGGLMAGASMVVWRIEDAAAQE